MVNEKGLKELGREDEEQLILNGKNRIELYVPKNDNIAPLLRDILGSTIMDIIGRMREIKRYKEMIDVGENTIVGLVIGGGEDFPGKIMKNTEIQRIGITGSDFVLSEVLASPKQFYRFRRGNGPYFNLRVEEAGHLYVRDLGKIVESDLEPGETIKFSGEDLETRMTILKQTIDVPPYLCLLGANDMTYEKVIEKRKGRDIPVACEARFKTLAKAFLDREERERGITFDFHEYTRTTEAYMRHGEEPHDGEGEDIGIEIGQTFKTARQNLLEVYQKIMRTYPVQVTCYKLEDRSERLSVSEIRKMVERAQAK